MRVLHIRKKFSILSETFIYDMVTELEDQFGEQHVLTFQIENFRDRPFPRIYEAHVQNRFHPWRLLHRVKATLGLIPHSMYLWPLIRERLQDVLDEIKPDIIHAHFGPEGALIAPVANKLNIPFVTSFYGYDASRLLDDSTWRETVQSLVLQGNTISLCNRMRAHLISMGACPDRSHIVHLGKSLDAYRFSPSDRVIRFLSIGRMAEKKGHMDAVEAFARVLQRYPYAHLDIVGGGELLQQVQERVEEKQLQASISIHGPQPHHRVKALLQNADAFLLCSKKASNGDCEGTPAVLLEAQAVGLPCVTTKHAGIPEIIPRENHHLLAEEGDIDGIAQRIEWLLRAKSSDIRSITERGREHIHAHFDVKKEAARLHQIYEQVLQN